MTYFLAEVIAIVMALIINELLCYMLAKIDSVPVDTLTRLVGENFSDNEVETAKSLLCDHVDDSIKAGNKRGQKKTKHNLDDIVKMLVQCDRSSLPKFVALDLSKLPPISIDCIDVSSLMRKQQLQDIEIANLKELVQEIMLVSVETSKKVESGLYSAPKHTVLSATSTASGVESPVSLDSSEKPGLEMPPVTRDPVLLSTSGPSHGSSVSPSYAEVVRDSAGNIGSSEWSVAKKKKRAKAPAPRRVTDRAMSVGRPTWRVIQFLSGS